MNTRLKIALDEMRHVQQEEMNKAAAEVSKILSRIRPNREVSVDDEKIHTMAETMAFVEAALREALGEVRKLMLVEGQEGTSLLRKFDGFTEDLLSKI
jgi:uncharacterized protein YyaL (SSP411 family)